MKIQTRVYTKYAIYTLKVRRNKFAYRPRERREYRELITCRPHNGHKFFTAPLRCSFEGPK